MTGLPPVCLLKEFEMLSGYKTYVACGLAILTYAAHWATGEISLMDAVNSAFPYLVGMFMRNGLARIE